MQSLNDIDKSYETPDPWGYQTNPEDIKRKNYILGVLKFVIPGSHTSIYDRWQYRDALDIGAGEGWISQDLPAYRISAYEVSDKAAARFPANVERVTQPTRTYDLVISTGTMYAHYHWGTFLHLIKTHASDIVLTSNIKDWEVPAVKEIGKEIFTAEFPYREYVQKLRVFKVKK